MWYLEANNFLSEAQYGCRRGRLSTMALAELDAHIHSANTNQAKLYYVFFDLENVFPGVWRHLILTTLYKYGLDSYHVFCKIILPTVSFGSE